MLLGTALYPGDSFRSGGAGEKESGTGSGVCIPELRPQRVGMWCE